MSGGRYFLDLVEDDRIISDSVGIELDREDDALAEAQRAAAWIAAGYHEDRQPSAAVILVRDAGGRWIAEVPVAIEGS